MNLKWKIKFIKYFNDEIDEIDELRIIQDM